MEKQLFGKIKGIDLENRIVDVVASTGDLDRHGEKVNPNGWILENYLKNPVVLWAHNYSELPIGKALKIWLEDNELMARIQFATHKFANEVWNLVKDKIIRAVSVGFRVLEENGENEISKAELYEISFVPVPANPNALVKLGYKEEEAKTLEEKFKILLELYKKEVEKEKEKWEICGKRDLPIDDEASWDGAKARKEIEKWADGDFEKYKKGFVIRNAAKKETLGAYKLPFARVKNNQLIATWGGVKNAMAAILGARGGVKIPEYIRKKAYNFLAGYYKRFEKEVPEYKRYNEEELKKILNENEQQEKKEIVIINKKELKELIRGVISEFFKEKKQVKEKRKEEKQKKILRKLSKEELLKQMLKHLREADKQVGLGLQKANLYQKKIKLLKAIKSYYRQKGGEKNGRR